MPSSQNAKMLRTRDNAWINDTPTTHNWINITNPDHTSAPPRASKRPRTGTVIEPRALKDRFDQRQNATEQFPPIITAATLRKAMKSRDEIIATSASSVQSSCASCGRFYTSESMTKLFPSNHCLEKMRHKDKKTFQLDSCGIDDTGAYKFCGECFTFVQKPGRFPKFSALNFCNEVFCQEYPDELKGLTIMEEQIIARSHPIGAILKLRPNGKPNPAAYNAIRGHIVTIPQEPGPLLTILPHPRLQFHDNIRVVWTGAGSPTENDLRPFLQVRKEKVLQALEWLCKNNVLYSGKVRINRDQIQNWPQDFVPQIFCHTTVFLREKEDTDQRGTYAGDVNGVQENDLHHALGEMADDAIASGVVYSDVDGERMQPELAMVMAMTEMMASDNNSSIEGHLSENLETPIIQYKQDGKIKPINDYEEPSYFSGAFPTLFPYGTGGHMPLVGERPVAISLQAWAKWTMNHHSRRFAQHPTFMYLVYDVLQRRMSALGHGLLCKREDWNKIKQQIQQLTHKQLVDAAESLRKTQKTDDPAINALRRAVQTVGYRVPNSYGQKQDMRLHIRGLLVEYGPAAFWLTINPSDMRDPLVLYLAGVNLSISPGKIASATANIREKAAVMNPAAVALYFDTICKSVLEGLIKPKDDEQGILGPVSTYFGVVETNGRGMLHLHCLVWLLGNLEFRNLRERLLKDDVLKCKIITYLESVIWERIEGISVGTETLQHLENTMEQDITKEHSNMNPVGQPERAYGMLLVKNACPRPDCYDSDEAYEAALRRYASKVAAMRQRHSPNHNATCFKYCTSKGECRFGFPRKLVDGSYIDDNGVVHLHRDDSWVNAYNICIAAATGSNHDISFLATKTRALAAIYYITNYATKDEASTYQMLMTAAILKEALERAEKSVDPTSEERRTLMKAMDKFSLRVFNRMAHDREISGVQVAAMLLQLPSFYTHPVQLQRVNLNYLRRRMEALITAGQNLDSVVAEEQLPVGLSHRQCVNIFDDYRCRGISLCGISFYEYVRTIFKRAPTGNGDEGIPFHNSHPECQDKSQYITSVASVPKLVGLLGSLSLEQRVEDRVCGGHVETLAIKNDLAVILLGLFVPWEMIPIYVSQFLSECGEDCADACDKTQHTGMQACAAIWTSVKITLPKYIQDLSENVELLRKSREDAIVDRIAQKARSLKLNSRPSAEIDDEDLEEPEEYVQLEPNSSTDLQAALLKVLTLWAKEDSSAAIGITALKKNSDTFCPEVLDAGQTVILESALGLRYDIYPEVLDIWRAMIKTAKSPKNLAKLGATAGTNAAEILAAPLDDEYDEYGTLNPSLTFESGLATQAASTLPTASSLIDNITASGITRMVSEILPLNTKQKRTVRMVFYYVLKNKDTLSVTHGEQLRLYVGGEGGTGKSRVINAIKYGMHILGRLNEVVVMALSGSAARNVGGSTIHAALGLKINESEGSERRNEITLNSLWRSKTMAMVDEVSMVSAEMLHRMDIKLKMLKSLDRDSTAMFGGLHIIIFLGDFYQFPPVREQPLWTVKKSDSSRHGQQLWYSIDNVIILDEQMRQQDDKTYHHLIQRARHGELTKADVDLLNTRVLNTLSTDSICIVRKNELRHMINRMQIERFARERKQKIYIFPASHDRKMAVNSKETPSIADVMAIPDQASVPGPGILMYTYGMPAMVLHNACTALGIVNGARGIVTEVIPKNNATFYPLNDLYILCDKPPVCAIIQEDGTQFSDAREDFPDMESKSFPIFTNKSRVSVSLGKNHRMSVKRTQLPITPAWALTEYKVQGSTYAKATLDLHNAVRNRGTKGNGGHKTFCSVYVQLSRLQSLRGVSLLEPLTLSDVAVKPSQLLKDEEQRLARLAEVTNVAWKRIESEEMLQERNT